ncbi:sugar transporter [Pseudomonas sp. F1_0610]|uniref:sugar transporter n=1 Tax=Pseudomonas sp. F1_0610 TaxID=3114284 RepID=UPI0039C48B84
MSTKNAQETQNLAWTRVIILAISGFIFNTTEFIPIALLSDIGHSFSLTEETTGLMVTVYAWVVALVSVPLMLLTGTVERRRLLVAVFFLFITGHIIVAFSPSFEVLLGGRIMIAFAHAVFWTITATLAVRLAPEGKKSLALGLLATGTSIATVLGLPLGRLIGQWLGWQQTFLSIGLLAAIAMVAVAYYLPSLPSINSGRLKNLPQMLTKPALLGLFLLTALIFTAHFATYTYIEPFAKQIVGMSEQATTWLLLVFGVAGIFGSFVFSRYNTVYPAKLLQGALLVVTASLLSLGFLSDSLWSFIGIAFFWGVAITCVGLGLQIKVLDLSPEATDLAMSIYSGIVNIGIGAGALMGSQVISFVGLANIGYSSTVLGLLAFALAVALFSLYYRLITGKTRQPKTKLLG